jgi:hypothetical protein
LLKEGGSVEDAFCTEPIPCLFILLLSLRVLADRYLGYRWAVILGALAMTLGHASMAVETPLFLYIGIGCLIVVMDYLS